MKITIFNGSPRGKNGNTNIMAESLLAGAKETGAKTENICLVYKKILQCAGCFGCWSKTPGKCVIRDDMEDLMKIFLDSDIVGLATPLYTGTMTALMKNFLDRMIPIATPQIVQRENGNFAHNGRVNNYPLIFVMSNAGFPGKNNFDILSMTFSRYRPIAEIYRNCGEVLRTGFPSVEQYKEALHTAGKELAQFRVISPQTMDRLNADLMSDKDYMENTNAFWERELKKK